MGRFRVLKRSFIGGLLVEPGAIVEYDGAAGTNLEPMDDDAKAQKLAPSSSPSSTGLDTTKRVLEPIPDDWAELAPRDRIMLARKLGAPNKGTTAVKADQFIKDELARRATV